MTFSNKIYKINDGENVSLYASSNNVLQYYFFDKILNHYDIMLQNNKKCIFSRKLNYKKVIKLNNDTICPCTNEFITLINENEIP